MPGGVIGNTTHFECVESAFEPWPENNMTFVDAIKAHAYAHYNEGGWDYVIETMTDSEIAKVVKRCETANAAIKKMGALCCGLWDRIRADIANPVDCDPCWDDPINKCNIPHETVVRVVDPDEVAYERHLDALAFSDTERDYRSTGS